MLGFGGARLRLDTGLLALLGMAGLGSSAIFLVTHGGIGLSTDSVAYIDGARRLMQGGGYTSGFNGRIGPITHWPPLYSAMLAGLGLLGVDPLDGARILAALLFGANIFVAGWLIRRHGRAGSLPALAASLLVLVSADLVEIHAWAWSEPVFLLLSALALHHLIVYLRRPHARRYLVVAALVVGLAVLTRYIGVTLGITAGLALLWLGTGTWRRRVADVALFGVVSAAPLAGWTLRNYLLTGSGSSRSLVVNMIGLDHLATAARTVSSWLVPPVVPEPIRALLLGVLLVVGFAVAARYAVAAQEALTNSMLKTLFCFFLAYGGFLTLSIILFDADVTYDERFLAPVHFFLLVAAGLLLSSLHRTRWRRARWMAYAGVGAASVLLGVHTFSWALRAEPGLGYADRTIRETPMWSLIEQLPTDTPLYSNAYDVVYIHTGRATRPVPGRFNPNTLLANDGDYTARLALLRADLVENEGLVIHLPVGEWRRYMPSESELRQALAPFESRTFPYGTVYRALPEVTSPDGR